MRNQELFGNNLDDIGHRAKDIQPKKKKKVKVTIVMLERTISQRYDKTDPIFLFF